MIISERRFMEPITRSDTLILLLIVIIIIINAQIRLNTQDEVTPKLMRLQIII